MEFSFETILIVVMGGIIYAFWKYGQMQWWAGFDKGVDQGYTKGLLNGSQSIVDLFIKLDIVTKEETIAIAQELMAGVHDNKFTPAEIKAVQDVKKKRNYK